jgi:hypothetical protein
LASIRKSHRQHEGELLVQSRRHAPSEMSDRALRAFGQSQSMPGIQLYYSCRSDEIELVRKMTDIELTVLLHGIRGLIR